MAERVGFEPTLEFPLNTLSKRAPSATRPSLRRFREATAKQVAHPFDCAQGRSKPDFGLRVCRLFDSMVRCPRPQPSERKVRRMIVRRTDESLELRAES